MQANQMSNYYNPVTNGQNVKSEPDIKPLVDLGNLNHPQDPASQVPANQPLQVVLPNVHLDGPSGEKLKEILASNGYRFEVTPGQRKYGGPPPGWQGGPLSPGHELFIGGVPKFCYEDKLIPAFEQFGQVWEVRLMTNPNSKEHKGFCFVSYYDREQAKHARKALDNYELLPNRRIQANMNQANARIFVGNVPKSKTQQEIRMEFTRLTEGLRDVIIYKNAMEPLKNNRGFAFLDFDSHMNAKLAFKKLSTEGVTAFNRTLIVSWAEPQEEPDDEVMAQVKALYIRGLTADVTEQMIKDMFGAYGVITNVRKIKDYSFVHFEQRDAALQAMNDLDSQRLGNSTMQITLAKPLLHKKEESKGRGPGPSRGKGGGGRGVPRSAPPMGRHAAPGYGGGSRGRGLPGGRRPPTARGRPRYDDDPHYPDEYDRFPPPPHHYDLYDEPYERLPPPPRMRRHYEYDDYDYPPHRAPRARSPPPEWDMRPTRRGSAYEPPARRPLPPAGYSRDPYRPPPPSREAVYGRRSEHEASYHEDEFVIGSKLYEDRMPQSARQIPAAQPAPRPPGGPLGAPRPPRPPLPNQEPLGWRTEAQAPQHPDPSVPEPPREPPQSRESVPDYGQAYQQPVKRPPPGSAPPTDVKKPRLDPWQQSGGDQLWERPTQRSAAVSATQPSWSTAGSQPAQAAAPPPPPRGPPSVVAYPDSSVRESSWQQSAAQPPYHAANAYPPAEEYNYAAAAPRPPADPYQGYPPPDHNARTRRY